jgi:hypothetical protein
MAETTFNPRLSVGRTYTDNVRYTAEAPEDSDAYTSYSLVLPVTTTTPSSTFVFSYRPVFNQFDDFGDLDHLEHVVDLSANTQVSRTTTVKYGLDFQDTQSQNYPLAGEGAQESLLYYRTERRLFGASVGIDRSLTPNWSGDLSLDVQHVEIDQISDFPAAIPLDELGDRRRVGVAVGGSRKLSGGRSAGFQYGVDSYDVDNRPSEEIHRLRGRFSGQPTRLLAYALSAGASYRSDREDTSAEASASVSRTFKRGALSAGVGHQATNAGVVPGGNTSTSASISYGDAGGDNWSWSVSGRWVDRSSDDPGDADVENVSGGFSVRYRLGDIGRGTVVNGMGLRLSARTVSQTSSDTELDASYHKASLAFVTYFGKRAGD